MRVIIIVSCVVLNNNIYISLLFLIQIMENKKYFGFGMIIIILVILFIASIFAVYTTYDFIDKTILAGIFFVIGVSVVIFNALGDIIEKTTGIRSKYTTILGFISILFSIGWFILLRGYVI